jgi:hypothetical protein
MKRSGEGEGGTPKIKRLNSNSTDISALDDEEDDPKYFCLRNQNKALSVDIFRCKRQISESRKELEMMRNKSREMETLVGVIQRAWSQVGAHRFTFVMSLNKNVRFSTSLIYNCLPHPS